MTQSRAEELSHIARAFRAAIERSRAEKVSPHLPYFPDGACRIVSRLFAVHLNRRGFEGIRYCEGHVPGFDDSVRHAWLVVEGSVVDLTADPFGQGPVVVASVSAFHESLDAIREVDAMAAAAAITPEAAERDGRLLAQIESRLGS